MKVALSLLALPAMGWAFPQLMGASREEMLQLLKQKRNEEIAAKRQEDPNIVDNVEKAANDLGLGIVGNAKRQEDPNTLDEVEKAANDLGLGIVGNAKEKRQGLVGGLVGTVADLTGDIAALTEAIAESVDPDNFRPEPGYEFKAPLPTDSRGPCPGLNLLANYGYLPRDGKVTLSQVIEANSRGFNMAADLTTVLGVFAILTQGNITEESFYLGAGPGYVGGLNRHSTVEADISPNREDFYNGCGDDHHLSSRLVKQMIACAAQSEAKDIGIKTMECHYATQAKFAQTYNPFLYYFPFPSIVSLGAYVFYPNFFSNGTYGQGGVANYESISAIIGAKYHNETGEFEYVPERWPESGWYRRSNPYGAVQTLVDAFVTLYPKYPVPMPIAQLGTPNFNVTNILCDVVQGLQSVTPLMLAGTTQTAEEAVSWALGKFAVVGLDGTTLGCPKNSLSPNVYANASQPGGPLNPPPSVIKNSGNNTYNKIYFGGSAAPTSPICAHTTDV